MLNERVNELLEYLETLASIQGSGHYVNEEIKEAIREVRIELGLEKKKNDTLKESRFLVFEAKLGGKTTFRQRAVFEAVFGSVEKEVDILFCSEDDMDVDRAVTVLKDMKAPVKFIFDDFRSYKSLTVERQ